MDNLARGATYNQLQLICDKKKNCKGHCRCVYQYDSNIPVEEEALQFDAGLAKLFKSHTEDEEFNRFSNLE